MFLLASFSVLGTVWFLTESTSLQVSPQPKSTADSRTRRRHLHSGKAGISFHTRRPLLRGSHAESAKMCFPPTPETGRLRPKSLPGSFLPRPLPAAYRGLSLWLTDGSPPLLSLHGRPFVPLFCSHVYVARCVMLVWVCAPMHASICVRVFTCMWRPEDSGRRLPQLLAM